MNDVSHGLDDPYRLPQHVRPTRYHLILEPDLVSATFQGRATIALTVLKETRVIVCNALDLAIFGSNSKDVVVKAHCPVLVVPAGRRSSLRAAS